jgi:hypothetical protein
VATSGIWRIASMTTSLSLILAMLPRPGFQGKAPPRHEPRAMQDSS